MESPKPKISVIIPVYNSQDFLKRCLDSVLNQTIPDIEIICADDCSTDNSGDILDEYSKSDSRIRVYHFSENKGAGFTRNFGVEKARGEYAGFVDSDDYIDLDFYEKLYKKAHSKNADCAKGEMREISDLSANPYVSCVYDLNTLIKKNKAYFYFNFTTAIYSKKFLDKYNIRFPEGLCHLEDPYFTIKAAIFYQNLEIVSGAKYYYDITGSSREKKKPQADIADSLIKGADKIVDLINASDITKSHYLIISSFLLGQILERFNYIDTADNSYDKLSVYIREFFIKIKYKDEILSSYYLYLKTLKMNFENNNKFRELQDKIKATA